MTVQRARRVTPPEAQRVLDEACTVNADVEAQEDRMERRRQLWAKARALGATERACAEACGVSESLVKLEVARARGKAWAQNGGHG